MEKLAINGGEPVRKVPMPAGYPGATMFDAQETVGLAEVVASKSPFRFYGPNCLGKTKKFETEFCKKFGTKHTCAVTSGTAAVMCALKALGIGAGDKVIVPACTFIATAGAVVCAGAVPVFTDIDDSLDMDPEDIERHIDKYTKAIITVPILGNPCKMDRIMEIANRHHIPVLEDAAQSCGSRYKGQYSGTFGAINAFSLQMNKIITTGEGGMITTNDPKLYERAVRYHDQGMFREKEGFLNVNEDSDVFIGEDYRMNEFSGAVALVQLAKLDEIIARMRHNKKIIKDGIKGIPGITFRTINDEDGDAGNALIVLLENRKKADAFRDALNYEGIPFGCLYGGTPIYMQPQIFHQMTADKSGFPFNQFDEPIVYTEDMCPNAVKILPRNAVMNIGPTWTDADCEDVVKGIRKVATQVL